MQQIRRSALIHLPPQTLFRLVDNVEGYPAFLPWCTQGRVLIDGGSWKQAEILLQKGPIRIRLISRNQLDPPHSIELVQVKGPCDSLKGRWDFRPAADNSTRVELAIDFKLKKRFRLLVNEGTLNRTATLIMDRFCAQAKRLSSE